MPLPAGFQPLDDDESDDTSSLPEGFEPIQAVSKLPDGFEPIKTSSQPMASSHDVPMASSHANTLLPTPLPNDRVSTYTPPKPSENVIDTSKPLLTVSDRLNEEMPDTTMLPTGSVRPGVPLYSGANQTPPTTAGTASRVATIPLRSAAGLVKKMSSPEPAIKLADMAAAPPLALMPVVEGGAALPAQGADVYKDIRSGDVGSLVTKSGPAFGTNAAMTGLMATYGARGLRGALPGEALPLESPATQ